MSFGIQRATIPAEFQDVVSKQLLMAPIPKFMHARLIMSAVGQKLNTNSMMLPLGPSRDIQSNGTYATLEQMQYMLSDDIAKQAVRVQEDFSEAAQRGGVGHTIRINRPVFDATTYTMASRRLQAGATISTVAINAKSEQVPLTVERWAGPYDSTNSRVAPIGINAFDASRAVHSIPAIADLQFQYDFHRTVDSFGVTLFDSVASGNILYAGSMTSNNSSTAVDDNPFDFEMLLRSKKSLDDLSIPTFTNGRRIMVLTTKQGNDLQKDEQYQRLAKVHPQFNPLFIESYLGSCAGFDILTSVTLTQTNNSSSVPIQHGQAFGPGMVGVGPASMPMVIPSTDDNYGQDFKAIWIWFAAFGILDERFGLSLRSS